MRLSLLPVGVAAFLLLAGPVTMSRAVADDAETCEKASGDEAIAACTRAINSGRWSGADLAWAYNNRGYAYQAKGDNDRAIADYTQAIQINPKYMYAYFDRGLANLFAGALPKALADLNQASALNPKYAYAALWLDIVGQRSNVPSRLSQAISTIDMTAWPAPVIRMFLGQMPAAAVLAAADDPDATKKKGQVCEANFYSGEWAMRQGAKDEAARLFRLAASDCPKTFNEWSADNAELKALGTAR
jgi:lipoprotein NlpI